MQNLQNLQNMQNISSSGGGSLASKFALIFDGVNDYGYQSHNREWCIEKLNDGSRNYLNCTGFGGYVGCTDMNQEFSVSSRSVQTLKFVGTIENLLQSMAMFSYGGYTTASILTSGQIQVELQGTGSMRINSTTALLPDTIYNIIIRVNNSLASGTARVIGDIDIFIDGVKDIKGSSATGNNTSTGSFLNWGAYDSTTNRWIGKMYSLTVRNRALSDGECASEGTSNFSIVNTDYLRTFNADNTSRSVGRNNRPSIPVGGLVYTEVDAGGNAIVFDGTSNGTPGIGTNAGISGGLTTNLTNNTSFTMEVNFKFDTLPGGGSGGLFASNFDVGLNVVSGNQLQFGARNGGTILSHSMTITAGTEYHVFLEYNANDQKIYAYNGTTLLNVGGTAIPGSFTFNDIAVGDNGILGGNPGSSKKRIYFARVYGKLLSSTEKQASITRGKAIPNDPMIIFEARPEGLKDVNLFTNTDNLGHADRVVGASTTRTLNYGTDPKGGNTSCRIQFSAGLNVVSNRFDQLKYIAQLNLSGGELASKTMVQKIFVRSAVAGQKFRLKMTHSIVSDYFSADQTATTEWKEYLFSQLFTSATNGTGIQGGIVQASDGSACDIEIRSPSGRYSGHNYFDYSCSIGYVGRFTQLAVCGEFQPFIDGANTAQSQVLFLIPGRYLHIRETTNSIQWRRETKRNSNPATFTLGSGYRKKTKFAVFSTYDGTNFIHEVWIDGELKGSHTSQFIATSFYSNLTVGQYSGTYFNGKQRGLRGYTFTGSLTSDEKKALTGEHIQLPNLTNIFNFLPKKSEQNSKVLEPQMGTDKKITLVNGVTKGSR